MSAWSLPFLVTSKATETLAEELRGGLCLQISRCKLTWTTGKCTGARGCVLHSPKRFVSIIYWGFFLSIRTPFLGSAQVSGGACDTSITLTCPEQKPASQSRRCVRFQGRFCFGRSQVRSEKSHQGRSLHSLYTSSSRTLSPGQMTERKAVY